MPLVSFADVWSEFRDSKCHGCGAPKGGTLAFCKGCYYALPTPMRSALWLRFGDGFEEAYTAAKRWLVNRRTAAHA